MNRPTVDLDRLHEGTLGPYGGEAGIMDYFLGNQLTLARVAYWSDRRTGRHRLEETRALSCLDF